MGTALAVVLVVVAFCLGAYLEFRLHKPTCDECDDYRARKVVER